MSMSMKEAKLAAEREGEAEEGPLIDMAKEEGRGELTTEAADGSLIACRGEEDEWRGEENGYDEGEGKAPEAPG